MKRNANLALLCLLLTVVFFGITALCWRAVKTKPAAAAHCQDEASCALVQQKENFFKDIGKTGAPDFIFSETKNNGKKKTKNIFADPLAPLEGKIPVTDFKPAKCIQLPKGTERNSSRRDCARADYADGTYALMGFCDGRLCDLSLFVPDGKEFELYLFNPDGRENTYVMFSGKEGIHQLNLYRQEYASATYYGKNVSETITVLPQEDAVMWEMRSPRDSFHTLFDMRQMLARTYFPKSKSPLIEEISRWDANGNIYTGEEESLLSVPEELYAPLHYCDFYPSACPKK